MNILFLTRRFYPHMGGVEKHVLEISKCLVKKKNHVTLLTELYDTDLAQKESLNGIEIIRIPIEKKVKRQKYSLWFYLFQNQQYIRDADIIHCHDVFMWYMPFRFLFPFKKIYTTFHGYEGKFPIEKKAIIVRRLSNFLSNDSINVGKFIEKWYGTKSALTTYGGIDSSLLKNLGKNKRHVIPHILFVGRLEKDTGIDLYLQSLRILKKKRMKYVFSALGDGSYRQRVEKYGRVYGFKENTKDIIGQSDIVFASSYLSILEALALRKNIIAVFANSLKEDYLTMSPFGNYITITSSPQEVARQIELVWKHSFNNTKVRQGYIYAKQHTWDKITDQYIKLWEKNNTKIHSR